MASRCGEAYQKWRNAGAPLIADLLPRYELKRPSGQREALAAARLVHVCKNCLKDSTALSTREARNLSQGMHMGGVVPGGWN